ncbi:FAD-dependent oxidoreductase [Kolteria novifilia]
MPFESSCTLCLLVVIGTIAGAKEKPKAIEADVCVYGATPSGIVAAIAVKREGRSVVIVEPSRWVGGVLGAGLKPLQDCPSYAATGGLTKELLPTLGKDFPWWEPSEKNDAKTGGDRVYGPDSIREDFESLLKVHGIEVIREHRVATCDLRDATIVKASFDLAPFDDLGCPPAEATAENNLTVAAKVFLDASYDGDLMKRAGVSYRVGREAAAEFDEPNAGVQPPMLLTPIDPFVTPGDPSSGLLKWVLADHGNDGGAADGYTQAYNYRYYTTSDPKRQYPITPPADYSPEDYELVGRYVSYLVDTIDDPAKLRKSLIGIFPGWKNSGEWNYQRDTLFSMAPLGISYLYADGDYATKSRVWKAHQDYLRGLHHFMSTDPRVPKSYREEVAALGLDARFHHETKGWPHQLYVRVARRLNGPYTVTAHDVYNQTSVDDPIGLAQYGIDVYPVRRIWVRDGDQVKVGVEGKMFVGGSKGPTNVPYPISYRAITPRAEECGNLLVPVCFSATHLGYASARMEPVFMICGESAGIAACHAIDEGTSVQKIDMATYRQALEKAKQKLVWDPNVDHPVRPPRGSKPRSYSFESLLDQSDTNGDGVVSLDEWNAAKPDWSWLFVVTDSNNDGRLTGAEYLALQKFKTENADWQVLLRKQGSSSLESP